MFDSDNLMFLKHKACILVGELYECERFYCSFHHFIEIKHIVIENETWMRLECDSSLYVKYSDIEAELGRYYVIICNQTNIGNPKWEDIFYQKGLYYKQDYIDSAYILMVARRKREDFLRGKEIWIFGAGNNGEQFRKDYQKEYNICGFISNYEYEKEKCGLPVVRLDEIRNKKNVFIVICSIYEISMYLQMLQMGMKVEYDFTFSAFFPKKLFVGIGMCQMLYSTRMLLHNKNFTGKFFCLCFGESMEFRTSMANRIRLKEYAEFCDVLFYQNIELKAEKSMDYTVIFNQYEHAIKINMPLYFFRGIHLQSGVFLRSNIQPTTISSEGAFSDIGLYCYKIDEEILKLLADGVDDEQILLRILSDDYFPAEEVIHQFESAVKGIRFLERYSDIKIEPFLKDNYRDRPVFTDTVHFGPELQIFVANELAKKMDIDGIDGSLQGELVDNFTSSWTYNAYVYPSVAKALGLNYCNNIKYQNTPYAIGKEMSLEEYIVKQINFVKRAQALWNWLDEERKRESHEDGTDTREHIM